MAAGRSAVGLLDSAGGRGTLACAAGALRVVSGRRSRLRVSARLLRCSSCLGLGCLVLIHASRSRCDSQRPCSRSPCLQLLCSRWCRVAAAWFSAALFSARFVCSCFVLAACGCRQRGSQRPCSRSPCSQLPCFRCLASCGRALILGGLVFGRFVLSRFVLGGGFPGCYDSLSVNLPVLAVAAMAGLPWFTDARSSWLELAARSCCGLHRRGLVCGAHVPQLFGCGGAGVDVRRCRRCS